MARVAVRKHMKHPIRVPHSFSLARDHNMSQQDLLAYTIHTTTCHIKQRHDIITIFV